MQRTAHSATISPGTRPDAPVSHNEAIITIKTAGLNFFAIVRL